MTTTAILAAYQHLAVAIDILPTGRALSEKYAPAILRHLATDEADEAHRAARDLAADIESALDGPVSAQERDWILESLSDAYKTI
ncbi:hypothetical protein Bra3105_06615 [Brachybacterium halotolerans subsp. kimchii]|uniref:hypothetical protein n=1 Tax=Brachybacterium halotolerans TaxID=2795215 RepID=UPI001E3F7ACC|nr:hypothetical protein [Brachybacterium halotolerans]UEJ83979.1 hypothetical protein Bra3105_06615 [Brachybacterium halotolerans subsp. kimchii]